MNENQIIQIFPPDEVLRPEWSNWLEAANLTVIPFDEEQLEYTVCILLFTPIRSKGPVLISPEEAWKNYIVTLFPDIKIVQLGFRRVLQTTNYWYYTHPPTEAGTAIHFAVCAKDWVPVDTLGIDLCQLWKKFRDGHNKEGFMDWFIVARRRTNFAIDKIESGLKNSEVLDYLFSDPATIEAFNNTIARWKRYYLYFIAAPCAADLAAIDQCVERIAHYVQLKTSVNLHSDLKTLADDFTKINDLLKKITPWFTYVRAT